MHCIPFSLRARISFSEYVPMLPRSSYITLTSTPSAALCARISVSVSQNLPDSIMKYSIKTYFLAFLRSSHISGNISSPRGQYFDVPFLQTGKPVDCDRCSSDCPRRRSSFFICAIISGQSETSGSATVCFACSSFLSRFFPVLL